MRGRSWTAVIVLVLGMLVGCHGKTPAAGATQSYPVRGKIVSVESGAQEVMLDHEAIPGLMMAMTMSYKVTDPVVLTEVHAGDRISATMLAEHDAAGPLNMRLKDVVVIAQARPDYKPAVQFHAPAPGEEVPDFKLLNQSGKTIDLKQFRGKVVVVTFIYTRCPLSDFCPRMSRNFAEIDKALQGDTVLYGKTHLLSVSFDPTYDTPKVLKSYGGGVTGKFTNETFAHWDFAAPPVAELAKMEQWFGVGVTPGDTAGALQHSLSTVVIGKDGKIVQFYPTNDWTVVDALGQIRTAVERN